ncbi:hypothetical protein LG634_15800 [Streptomyces bambusae]|uniref:COG1470 family protein n=1 Tax=Streptomyces bambusae TaxID=1550616 RepID=UPI001CFCD0B0|nr:hypothetical protein [Streptomyces bambusae]MCB5166293.1 hypothetical protein [Streptomyces bambusae]
MPSRTSRRTAAPALALLALLPFTPSEARAAAPADWTAAPAAGSGSGRTWFYLQGTPGAVLEDRLALTNPSDRVRTVALRGSAPAGGAAAGAGAWIRFADTDVRIPPRTRAVVPFSVTVPAGAVPGDHRALVVAAGGGRSTGVEVQVRVGGPAVAALTVEDVSVGGSGRGAVLRYTLVNRGNTALRPQVAVRAEGVLGPLPAPVPRTGGALAPGRRAERTLPWPDAPALDSVDLTLTATAPGGVRATARTTARFAPWPALAGTAAAAAAATALLVRAGRRRRPRPTPAAEPTGAAS